MWSSVDGGCDKNVSDLAERARNRLVTLRGHFSTPVRIEDVEEIADDTLLVRVRTGDGHPDETVLATADLEGALATLHERPATVGARDFFRWVEGYRIRLAFAHDPDFAVSLSGVRGLPHQVEAVYRHLLPQPRLRFVLADDPEAGKTIMAGLLLKELKTAEHGRQGARRVAGAAHDPVAGRVSRKVRRALRGRHLSAGALAAWREPWQRYPQIVTSLDFAKRDDVRPDLLRADWDLVIIDEAHKCSAYTEGDGVHRTRRYLLAEELAARTERLLLLTATPHSGDEDRFTHFLGLLDPDQFSTPELVKRQIASTRAPTSSAARRRT